MTEDRKEEAGRGPGREGRDEAGPAAGMGPFASSWAGIMGSFFGVGLLPLFPGTWASAVAAGMYGLMLAEGWAGHWQVCAAAAAFAVLALASGSAAERHAGRKDPREFVLDEFAGFFLTVALQPCYCVAAGIAGFAAFRLFDVVKPFPCRRLERLTGAPGILLDDLAAGVYANLTLRVALHIFN